MISIHNLKKEIKGAKILHEISFEVKDGEILGFLGPNGAGKSTTMKILTGFWTPSGGEVKVNGLDVEKDSLAIRARIGYLPENVPLYDEMKVIEYLRFIAQIRGIAKGEIAGKISKAAAACGLTDRLQQPIEELSKGYRQRVGLAQAIIHEPDILILDEPTTGLDPNQIVEIRNLIKEIGRNKTVIFSTHILSEVQATCDRVVIINKGTIVGQGTPRDLLAQGGGTEIIYVKLRGPREPIMTALKALAHIETVVERDREADDIIGYDITPHAGTDVREELSGIVMQNNWSILEFSRKGATLEDVFRALTR